MALKKKLRNQLAQVTTAAEKIETICKRTFSPDLTATVESHLTMSGNYFSRKVSIHAPSLCGSEKKLSSSKNCRASFSSQRKTEEVKRHIDSDQLSEGAELMIAEKSETASVITGAYPFGQFETLEGQKGKGQRMDVSRVRHCSSILKNLMTHPVGWVFNQPVDPVKLNIPDYFSIISEPMDLGTIKNKLEAKLYLDTHEFAADVRLTFSNAMRYNPPSNQVHMMAKKLNNVFNVKWKSLETKLRKEDSHTLPQVQLRKVPKQDLNSGSMFRRTASNFSSTKVLSCLERQMLRKHLARISSGVMPPQLLNFLQKYGILGRKGERFAVDIDELDEETVLELHKLISTDIRSVELSKISRDMGSGREQGSLQDSHKGYKGSKRLKHHHASEKPLTSPFTCIDGTCHSLNFQCSHYNDFTQALSSDVESERSTGGGNHVSPVIAPNLTRKRMAVGEKGSGLNQDSDGGKDVGALGFVDEESARTDSPTTPPSTFGEGEENPLFEEHLSPNKALRAAMLKSRFVDTILKAQQKTLLNHGEKSDPAKMQREREKLAKKQREEKARIEAQVKAAEAAARMKAEADLKLQREKEREAARLALQNMEKTVDIDENREILKDLEILGYSQPSLCIETPDEMVVNFMDGVELQPGIVNPLEQLGLFMKNDDLDEADDWTSSARNGDVEEGEIASS